ncbi:MAG: sulfatase [Planctomycetes bacterium]|nr:sulfatase [Planctomycetota bacterium]
MSCSPRPAAGSAAAIPSSAGRVLGAVVGLGLATLLLLTGLLVWTRFWPGGAARTPRIPHVILLTIDTLRADSLPFHGNTRVKTPALAEIARRSVLFDHALAPSPWTRPSVISILTGLSPAVHGVTVDSIDVETLLPDSVRTLAECMRAAGYRTAAIGYNPAIAASPNVRRGFDDFLFYPEPEDESDPSAAESAPPASTGRAADDVAGRIDVDNATEILTELAERWLAGHASGPFFLWLHYYDPHTPYTAPREQYVALMGEEATEGQAYLDWRTAMIQGMAQYLYIERMALAGTDSGESPEKAALLRAALHQRREALRALYDGEVQHVDQAVGRVLGALKRLGIYDGSLLVVTSDHGEEFFEHGGLDHGHTLYQELLHVPLLLKRPGAREGHRVRERVTNRSLFPTLLELCSDVRPGLGVDVESLVPFWEPGAVPARAAYLLADSILFGEPATAIFFGDRKYTRQPRTGAEELYDLAADPGETTSLTASDPAGTAEGHRLFSDAMRRAAAFQRAVWIDGVRTTEVSEATRRMLRTHGYLK